MKQIDFPLELPVNQSVEMWNDVPRVPRLQHIETVVCCGSPRIMPGQLIQFNSLYVVVETMQKQIDHLPVVPHKAVAIGNLEELFVVGSRKKM